MNYLKVYCNLIRKAENRTPPEGYTEKHHTFPKSIFGNNNRIVILSGREHYIAHSLLEKICIKRYGFKSKRTYQMNCALIAMKAKRNYFNSRLYENAKIRASAIRKQFHKDRKHTKKTIEKIRLSKIGGKHTPEHCLKISQSNKGKPATNGFKNKKHTAQSKEKIRQSNKGKDRSFLNEYNWWNNGNKEIFTKKELLDNHNNDFIRGRLKKQKPSNIDKKIKKPKSNKCGKYRRTEQHISKLKECNKVYVYEIISPDNQKFIVDNMNQFCYDNLQYGLDRSAMNRVGRGKQKAHKGWNVTIIKKL